MAQLAQVLGALVDGGEVIAGQLAHLAAKNTGAVGNQDLSLADPARIQKEVAGRRVARVVLIAEVEVQLAERDPRCLAAPASLDDLRLERQHGYELCARLRRELGLEARHEAQPRDPDFDLYGRDPTGVAAIDVRPTIWKT